MAADDNSADDKPYDWAGGAAPPEKFDIGKAAGFLGKSILIGVTYLDAAGEESRQLSMHGVIESATPEGIKVSLRGTRQGQSWNMPPNLDTISPMAPGTYKLRDTEEVVENPDLVVLWTIAKPRPKPESGKEPEAG
ncbi:MAG: hypothetical protein EXR00_05650 [Alphaproteobacteria bacterium]|nr:hypothetical protein [Alphaproteobacteria bacterium]